MKDEPTVKAYIFSRLGLNPEKTDWDDFSDRLDEVVEEAKAHCPLPLVGMDRRGRGSRDSGSIGRGMPVFGCGVS